MYAALYQAPGYTLTLVVVVVVVVVSEVMFPFHNDKLMVQPHGTSKLTK